MIGRRTLAGLGVGIAAAGAAAAVGVAADRLSSGRRTARALDPAADSADDYEVEAGEELVVVADDGVPLYVEIDNPDRAADDPRPTVVFTHGYTLNRKCWIFQRRAFAAQGFRVVVWDERGHGLSGMGSRESYTVEQLGRDLARVLAEAAPTGPLVLVGHSMGGMTIMSLAAHDHSLIHDRVIGVAFVSTSPGGLDTVSWDLGQLLGGMLHRVAPVALGTLAPRQGLVSTVRRAGRDVEQFFVQRYSFASPVPASIVRLAGDMIFGTSLEVMSHLMPAFDQHDKRDALAQFNGVETLVLNGVEDLLTPPQHSEEIVRRVPGAEHVLVSDAGHLVMLEHPTVVTEQLQELVERAMRGAERVDSDPKPRVRRQVTDLSKRRQVATARSRRGRDAS